MATEADAGSLEVVEVALDGRRGESTVDLADQVQNALSHLHDLTYLQVHPLAHHAAGAAPTKTANPGKALRQSLEEAIEAVKPARESPGTSHGWRCYEILRLRYLEGLEVKVALERLSVGRSEYYRDHKQAVEAVTVLLHQRWGLRETGESTTGSSEVDLSSGAREGTTGAATHDSAGGALTTPQSNLPFQLSSFIGREKEIAEVKRLIREHRLVTLTGTGGCGKTRLAYQVAADLLDLYSNGVWTVELAGLSDPGLVPLTVASSIGRQEQPGVPILKTLVGYLKPKRVLVVLDNCEHLVDACARLAESLLRTCPDVRILATSREPLGVPGETAWQVPSLDFPEEDGQPISLDRLADYGSVRLFLERARQVQPGFSVTPQDAAALAEVCRRLDGIPLAIELAAARMGGLTVEEMATRLDNRFALLTGGTRTALPRQRTLRAAVEWSYNLLDERERTLLRRLAVFAGGWTLEAAEAVFGGQGQEEFEQGRCDLTLVGRDPTTSASVSPSSSAADGLLEVLMQLVRKSLVLAESSGGQTRYRMLETIRLYASERLRESSEADASRRAHADYFLGVVTSAEPELDGRRHREWLDLLEVERANLRLALRSFESVGDVQSGLRLAVGLFRFWLHRGPFSEAIWWLETFLNHPRAKGTPRGVEALSRLSVFALMASGSRVARPYAEEALRLARELAEPRALALALWATGGVQDDLREFRRYTIEALEIFREVGDQTLSAICLRRLGQVARSLGDLTEARDRFEESLGIFRRLGSPHQIGLNLWNLAQVALLQGDLATAWAQGEESLQSLEHAGDRTYVISAMALQAAVLRLRGEYERAWSLTQAALVKNESAADESVATVWVLNELGLIASARGHLDVGRRHLEASLARFRERHDPFEVALALADLGLVARAQGHLEESRALLSESLAIHRELGAQYGIAVCLGNLGVVALLEGEHLEAERCLAESLRLRRQMGDRGGMATLLESFGGLAALRGQPERALRLMGAGSTIREAVGNVAPPVWRRQRDPWMERARQVLDADFASIAWAEGQAMTLDEAAEYALRDEAGA